MDLATSLFGAFLPSVPVYLAWLAGAVVAIARWRQHPRVSLLVIGALAILLFGSIVAGAFSAILPALLVRTDAPEAAVSAAAFVAYARGLSDTLAFALLFWAVLADRDERARNALQLST